MKSVNSMIGTGFHITDINKCLTENYEAGRIENQQNTGLVCWLVVQFSWLSETIRGMASVRVFLRDPNPHLRKRNTWHFDSTCLILPLKKQM